MAPAKKTEEKAPAAETKKKSAKVEAVATEAAPAKKSAKKTTKVESTEDKKKEKVATSEVVIEAATEEVVVSDAPVQKAKPAEKLNWGILFIYSSYNNTHLHVTDITGSETITKVTGGMVTKSDRLKASPNVAMAAAKQVSEACLAKGVNALYVKLRAVGGHNGPMTPGPGSQAAIRMLTRYGIKLGRIEDVTPVPHDKCRPKGGKRGRRV